MYFIHRQFHCMLIRLYYRMQISEELFKEVALNKKILYLESCN